MALIQGLFSRLFRLSGRFKKLRIGIQKFVFRVDGDAKFSRFFEF